MVEQSIQGLATGSFFPLAVPPRLHSRLGPKLQKKSWSSPTKSTETQLQGLQEESRGDAKLLCFN